MACFYETLALITVIVLEWILFFFIVICLKYNNKVHIRYYKVSRLYAFFKNFFINEPWNAISRLILDYFWCEPWIIFSILCCMRQPAAISALDEHRKKKIVKLIVQVDLWHSFTVVYFNAYRKSKWAKSVGFCRRQAVYMESCRSLLQSAAGFCSG